MRSELGNSQIDLMLLAVLEAGPSHGYGVIVALRERSSGTFDLPEGTVYPALHRLEAAGLVASSRTTVSGRQRRTYMLTSRGRQALARRREDWRRTANGVHAVLSATQ